MKIFITLPLIFLSVTSAFSQSIIEWSPNYQLQLSDFKSPQTELNKQRSTYSIYLGANMDFSFSMSNAEFMFTKNFNTKAKTVFNRNASIIIAPDSSTMLQLLNFGRYSFDLTELYTRKFRQQMYEQKGVFSDVTFFNPLYTRLQEELQAENARVLKITNIGEEKELLEMEHQNVRVQIEELSDFCFSCKPPKKKK